MPPRVRLDGDSILASPPPRCFREFPPSVLLSRVRRCWRGLARRFRTLYVARRRGVAVRLAGSPPSVRNGRVSGDWMAWVGRLRARASNCRRPLRFSLFPERRSGLAGARYGILCCLPLEGNSMAFRCPRPPCAPRGAGWTQGGLRDPGVPRDSSRGRRGSWGLRPFSRMRNVVRGRGASASLRPS